MDVNEYRHNYEGFCEKFMYPMSINKGTITIAQGDHVSIIRILSFLFSLSLSQEH